MIKKWNYEGLENYDLSKQDKKFIELLDKNNYKVKAYRFYNERTEYLIEKDNKELSYNIWHNRNSKAELSFEIFETLLLTVKECL